jgi:hypothetical protein
MYPRATPSRNATSSIAKICRVYDSAFMIVDFSYEKGVGGNWKMEID